MLGYRCRILTGAFAVLVALSCGCGADRTTNPSAVPPVSEDTASGTASSSPEISPDHFVLSQPGPATFRIYDSQGAVVRTIILTLDAGMNELEWDGLTDSGLPVGSGVYMYVLDFSGESSLVGRIVLAR